MRHVVAISDLHLGGGEHPMLGHPDRLVDFLEKLAAYAPSAGEELELVIHGDFIDFLAEAPSEAWTADEGHAVDKINAVFRRLPALFDALARCAGSLRRFTVMLGNHDIELAYPRVRESLFRRLGTDPHRCHFVQNNESYRIGDLLIEHGNRYDPWNAIDHDGLRQTVSAVSRGELPMRTLDPCPGSQFVAEVMNPLKERYHFIDLLKPEDKLVALLLSTFEPELKRDLSFLFNAASTYAAQYYRKAAWKVAARGQAPGQRQLVSRASLDELPRAVEEAFSEELLSGEARQPVGIGRRLRKLFLGDEAASLKARLERGEAIEPDRLRKLQVALRCKLSGDATFDEGDAAGPYAAAARDMIDAGVARVVIMGHTHLRRDIPQAGGGRYLNTGTWADMIRVDDALYDDSQEGRTALVDWLRKLVKNDIGDLRICDPSYADVRLDDDLHVIEDGRPMLHRYGAGALFG